MKQENLPGELISHNTWGPQDIAITRVSEEQAQALLLSPKTVGLEGFLIRDGSRSKWNRRFLGRHAVTNGLQFEDGSFYETSIHILSPGFITRSIRKVLGKDPSTFKALFWQSQVPAEVREGMTEAAEVLWPQSTAKLG